MPQQSIYVCVLMLLYIVIYLNTPYIQGEDSVITRYVYIFSYFPMVAYYIILFPHSVLIPTKEFFPNLPDRLAIDATIVIAWAGLIIMFFLLLGVKYFYKVTI